MDMKTEVAACLVKTLERMKDQKIVRNAQSCTHATILCQANVVVCSITILSDNHHVIKFSTIHPIKPFPQPSLVRIVTDGQMP